MKLSQPRAYHGIKALHGSTGQPIRCTPIGMVAPEVEDHADNSHRPTEACPCAKCNESKGHLQ